MTTTTRIIKFLTALMFSVSCFSALAEDKFKVAILMFDEVQIIDFAGPYEVFGHARFDVFTVSKDGKPIQTVMGLNVTPTYSFANMPIADAIVIPGGNVHHAMANKDIHSWLLSQQGEAQYMLSVCTGSHILAEAGLLDGKAATTFHRAINWLQSDYPNIDVRPEKRFVDNGQIITSAGLSSGMDASLHLVGKVLGLDRAKTIAMHIEYDWDHEGGFVRATMADGRFPDNHYDWPEGVHFERTSSYGDNDYWQKTYKVITPVSIDKLVKAYQEAMSQHDNWVAEQNTGSGQYLWQGLTENANWYKQLDVIETAQSNEYVLRVHVQKTS